MPFALGPALTALAPLAGQVSPALGTIVRAVGAGFSAPSVAPAPLIPAAAPVLSGAARAVGSGVVSGVVSSLFGGSSSSGSGGRLKSILDAASQAAGKRITSRQIVQSVRSIGIQATADALGISAEDVAFVFVARRRRRARGISAADLRRTRSTLRKVRSIERSLGMHHPTRTRRVPVRSTSIVKA